MSTEREEMKEKGKKKKEKRKREGISRAVGEEREERK